VKWNEDLEHLILFCHFVLIKSEVFGLFCSNIFIYIFPEDRYKPRVRPQSDNDDNKVSIVKQDTRRQRTQAAYRQQSKSDSELDPAELERLHLQEQLRRKDQLASIPVKRKRSLQPADSTETDQDVSAGEHQVSTPGGAPGVGTWGKNVASEKTDETTTDGESISEQSLQLAPEGSSECDRVGDRSETQSESSTSSTERLNDTENNLSQYHKEMVRMERDEASTEMEDDSQSGSGSETAVETETEAPQINTLGYVFAQSPIKDHNMTPHGH
jgi:hypothetical protein